MMKMRFNRMERLAGSFILFAVLGTFVSGGAVLVRKGFFDHTLPFRTVIPSSESIYSGMPVLMSGVRIGRVDDIDLDANGQAEVRFTVRSKYASRVKEDSRVSIARQSWIGEKIFDVSTGSEGSPSAKPGQFIELRSSGDVMGALTGARVGKILDDVDQLVVAMTEVARQLSRKKNAEVLLGNLRQTSESLTEMAATFPQVGRDVGAITAQLSVLSAELSRKSPDGNTRIAQIVEETSILIRALQRNFLVRGSVSDVRKEEQKQQQSSEPAAEAQRLPASETGAP